LDRNGDILDEYGDRLAEAFIVPAGYSEKMGKSHCQLEVNKYQADNNTGLKMIVTFSGNPN